MKICHNIIVLFFFFNINKSKGPITNFELSLNSMMPSACYQVLPSDGWSWPQQTKSFKHGGTSLKAWRETSPRGLMRTITNSLNKRRQMCIFIWLVMRSSVIDFIFIGNGHMHIWFSYYFIELEDMSNIMRVISLKNYCDNTRVVIQLLQYQNKVRFLTNRVTVFQSVKLNWVFLTITITL